MNQNLEVNLDQLNDEADIAADYLEGFLDIADVDGDIEVGVRQGRPMVQIVAEEDEDLSQLIGRDGQVVSALQHLTRLAVQESTGERSRVIVDVDGYLKKKREKIVQAALDAVQEVLDTGESVNLRPMNSYERKIVHDVIRDEGLKSRSHGIDPKRYVTVYQKQVISEDDIESEDFDTEDEE
ncbi:protein jag [Alloscardovia venturai]|uniref:Protein jag n=1 Tax=Alloscardovia venturai TaxID=1769421 RepID=A0ABW2Y678_9BIFI